MKEERWAAGGLIALLSFIFPFFAHAATADLSITQSQITFSKSTLYAGDVVRIYARVRNLGETDMTATVFFYQSDMLIASAQPISLPAEGAMEEVFVDYTIPEGSFNIRAIIQGSDPTDENPSNNEATTPLYTSVEDADRDDIADDDDNCITVANTDQTDTDQDGQGDACDSDDDDDGLSDSKEQTVGTNPLNVDTDDDGMNDKADTSPLVVQIPEPTHTVETVQTPTTASPTSVVVSRSEENTATEDEKTVGIASPTTAYGVLHISPRAYFSYIQRDWNTYGFAVQSPQDGMTYTWDFGDGSSSTMLSVDHDYDGPNSFTVTLASRDVEGNEDADMQDVSVSFFNLQNPWVQALLGFGVVVLCVLGVVLVTMRRQHEDEV